MRHVHVSLQLVTRRSRVVPDPDCTVQPSHACKHQCSSLLNNRHQHTKLLDHEAHELGVRGLLGALDILAWVSATNYLHTRTALAYFSHALLGSSILPTISTRLAQELLHSNTCVLYEFVHSRVQRSCCCFVDWSQRSVKPTVKTDAGTNSPPA